MPRIAITDHLFSICSKNSMPFIVGMLLSERLINGQVARVGEVASKDLYIKTALPKLRFKISSSNSNALYCI